MIAMIRVESNASYSINLNGNYCKYKIMKKILIILLAFIFTNQIMAQEVDLFKAMNDDANKKDSLKKEYVDATFKSTHLINGHSIETTKAGLLDFRISHRFGLLNQGSYEFFGLDNATERLGLDYGITNGICIGIGRSTYQKQMDGFVNDYIQKHLQFQLNGKAVQLGFVGYEQQSESIWTYLEIKNINTVQKINVVNSLLHDYTDKQINMMHVKVDENEQSFKLDYPDTEAAFSF